MRHLKTGLVTLVPFLSTVSAKVYADSARDRCLIRLEKSTSAQPAEARQAICNLESFFKYARKLQQTEPYLFKNDSFLELQSFTLKNQRSVARDEKHIQRFLILGLNYVRQAELQGSYEYFFKKAQEIWPLLPDHIILHQEMIYAQDPKSEEAAKLQKALEIDRSFKTISSDFAAKQWTYVSMECDYTSQPTNALWFSLTSAALIKELQISLSSDSAEKARLNKDLQGLILIFQQFSQGWEPRVDLRETRPAFKF